MSLPSLLPLFALLLPGDTPPAETIAATVNGSPITLHAVDLELARALGEREVETSALPHLKATALRQLINRELILEWLTDREQIATQAEIQLAINRLKKRLAAQEIPLEDYLQRRKMTPSDLEHALRWQLSWDEFLQRYVTDQNLERFFKDRRAQFDGTRLRVAHILLSVAARASESARDKELAAKQEFAAQLRVRITSRELTFAEAARLHSDAPTAENGGDIGLISRHSPMPEAFSRAAYELAQDAISEPVTTAFGVHLIQCLEILPGQKRWQDVRDELEPALARYLFDWAAEQGKARAEIKFTGHAPHFEPGTERVVK